MTDHSGHTDTPADECCGQGQKHESSPRLRFHPKEHWKPLAGFLMLATGMTLDHLFQAAWFNGPLRLIWYLAAYLPVALPVLLQAVRHITRGNIFTEFFLMSIATLGALFIGEYPEAVAVMLFYSVGEAFQDGAIRRAKDNIRSLLDVRPEVASVWRNGEWVSVHSSEVSIGETIRVRPGERVPLDGHLISDYSSLDTSALTGESLPRTVNRGEKVLAGMINSGQLIEIEVLNTFENSAISRILKLVQEASSRKAKTELFIRSFARIYTPVVVFLAALLVFLPAFLVQPWIFEEWLYRGLVFLVISCPCALVISIPLGYFGGIGAASQNGILVKGANFLDTLRSVETVVFDKTGTLTGGEMEVRSVWLHGSRVEPAREPSAAPGHSPEHKAEWAEQTLRELSSLLFTIERGSTHPVARAVAAFAEERAVAGPDAEGQEEIAGLGVRASVGGREVLIGSTKLMERAGILFDPVSGPPDLIATEVTASDEGTSSAKDGTTAQQANDVKWMQNGSAICVAVDGSPAATLYLTDRVRPDAASAIRELRKLGIKRMAMLSGDREEAVREIGELLNIEHLYSGLLPEEKVEKLEELKRSFHGLTAYAGDGINDAPVLAASDVGIAMGGMGSDAAVESADIVIQTDQPSKIATSIRIARATRTIVWQNIGMAMGIKILFLALGALGIATLWEAVFADVGVALLAILNAIRIQKMKFI
ncbi:MAG: heavy metal translocating P-type ATPase [Balneolaceae bacterium]